MQNSGWQWCAAGPFPPVPLAHRPPPCPPRYQGCVCRQYRCEGDDLGAASIWAKFEGDSYVTKIDTESFKSGSIKILVLREAAPARAAA